MIVKGAVSKPKDSFGKVIPEVVVCLDCALPFLQPTPAGGGGLTWTVGVCSKCGSHTQIVTEKKNLKGFK